MEEALIVDSMVDFQEVDIFRDILHFRQALFLLKELLVSLIAMQQLTCLQDMLVSILKIA